MRIRSRLATAMDGVLLLALALIVGSTAKAPARPGSKLVAVLAAAANTADLGASERERGVDGTGHDRVGRRDAGRAVRVWRTAIRWCWVHARDAGVAQDRQLAVRGSRRWRQRECVDRPANGRLVRQLSRRSRGAVYNPHTNIWRRLPNGPLGVREGYASVWTGKELLIFGGHAGDGIATPTAAAVNPQTGSWQRLPTLDAVKGLAVANGAVWDGREAFVSGDLYHHDRFAGPILLAFSPETDKVREIDLAKAPIAPNQRSQLDPVGWSGTEVVFWTGAVSSSSLVVRYNPASGRWKKASAAPCTGSTQIAWIRNGVVAGCGTSGVQIYSPRTDSWRTINTEPSPLNTKERSAIVWTGTNLIVWSGAVSKPFNPTPADGASITLKGI